jgi:hypothetical protein
MRILRQRQQRLPRQRLVDTLSAPSRNTPSESLTLPPLLEKGEYGERQTAKWINPLEFSAAYAVILNLLNSVIPQKPAP